MKHVSLTLDEAPPPAVYTTVRVLDMQRLSRSLRRRGERGREVAQAITSAGEPCVVAIDRESGEGPRLEFSLFEGVILVSSHLSPVWDETRLSEAAIERIARAIRVRARVAAQVRDLGRID